MKKIIASFAVVLFTVNIFAQVSAVTDKEKTTVQFQNIEQKTEKKGLLFENGKVWKVKNDRSIKVLNKEITLGPGVIIKPDGSVLFKDGASTALREGDFVSMTGMIERAAPVKVSGRK